MNIFVWAKKPEKVLFYNGNSTWKIWHTFFVFGENERKIKPFLIKIKKNAWAPKNSKKCYFTMGIQPGKSGIDFPVFEEREKKMKQFCPIIKIIVWAQKT